MKRIMIVSDNEDLVAHMMNVVSNQFSSKDFLFEFFFTTANKSPGALIEMGMLAVDMKNDIDVERIIEVYDLVMSLHCKQIFPKRLIDKVLCINIHPGFNPDNRGWYPQVFSLVNKKRIGVTIHVMDADVDHGKIIFQEEVKMAVDDTSLSLYTRIVELEKIMISRYIREIVSGNYNLMDPGGEGNYNSIRDFDDLRCLDVNSVGTLKEHIDLLRALTHGEFRNAYFIDEGKKIYLQLKLLRE